MIAGHPRLGLRNGIGFFIHDFPSWMASLDISRLPYLWTQGDIIHKSAGRLSRIAMRDTDDYDPYQQAATDEPRTWRMVPQHDGHDAVSPLSPDAKEFLSQTETACVVSPIQPGSYPVTSGAAMNAQSGVGTSQNQSRMRETRDRTPLIRSWWREILSAILSVLCLVAIILVLFKIDGILLSSWTAFASPNAVISILSTAAKAAIILPVAESISQLKWLHLNSKSR